MSIAVVLAAYAVAVPALAAPMLRASGWVDRAPRLAIACWQALTVASVGAILLAGLVLAVPASAWSLDLAELVDACVMMIRAAYDTPGSALIVTGGLLASALIVVRLAHGVLAELATVWRDRRRHAEVLEMVARRDSRLGALVVDHDEAVAYCLPGRGGRIVLSSCVLAALGEDELAAVLAHERAHLRQRHHLLVAVARGVRRAFPFVPAFHAAEEEIGRLTELAADDAAARRAGRLTVAEALLTLAAGPLVPAAALAASGGNTAERVRRLLKRQHRLHVVATLTAWALVAVAVAVPVLIVAAPAYAAAGANCCP